MRSDDRTNRVGTYLIIGAVLITTLLSFRIINKRFGWDKSPVGMAHFDYFQYKGQDTYYAENPLPGNDYFYNPVLPGWNSDPSICQRGEDYFLVTSSFVYFPGVPIFHSTDLVHWEQIGFVLDRSTQLKLDGQHTSMGIFAPAISYNPHNETFYMITTNVGAGNFFVKTKDPFGSWSDPVWLPEVHGIDPSFFFDDDGRAYILNNDEPAGTPRYEGHRAIRIREFDVEKEKVIGEERILLDGGVRPEENPIWIEGPHIYNINGRYYLMAAEGGTGPMHSEVILRGDSPMGTYIPWEENPILTQRHLDPNRENPITCAGHADLVQDESGDWWSVFLACRPIENKFENLGRETFLMPVYWSEDSFPYMTRNDDLIPMIVQKKGVERREDIEAGNFEKRYDFDSARLDVDWFTLRTSADSVVSLSEKSGFLTLKCTPVTAKEKKTPAYVTRRIQHHRFECMAGLTLKARDSADAAGLLMYKDEGHQYFLSVKDKENNLEISLIQIGREADTILASAMGSDNREPVNLRIVSNGKTLDFYYGSGNSAEELLISGVDAHYLSTANSYGFTGTTIGMYATRNKTLFKAASGEE